MKSLAIKALSGNLFLMLVMAGVIFLPAWTFDYWQAWVFLAVFGTSALLITLYLMKKDPKLLERRVQAGPVAEKNTKQKVIQIITGAGFIAMLLMPAFAHRFGWQTVPVYLEIAGDVFVAAGFIIIFFVFKQNSFASATIDLYAEQKVISTGLYAVVRHPMYMGALFLFIGIPPALGSWWGSCGAGVILLGLVWRIFDEENFLTINLPGYREYLTKVKYRMVPFIW